MPKLQNGQKRRVDTKDLARSRVTRDRILQLYNINVFRNWNTEGRFSLEDGVSAFLEAVKKEHREALDPAEAEIWDRSPDTQVLLERRVWVTVYDAPTLPFNSVRHRHRKQTSSRG